MTLQEFVRSHCISLAGNYSMRIYRARIFIRGAKEATNALPSVIVSKAAAIYYVDIKDI